MASGNITVQTNLAGTQSPSDLVYVGKSPFGPTDDRKSTLNDLFSIITKNITDKALRFQGVATASAPAVSAAGAGSIYFNSDQNLFLASQNGAAYIPLIAQPGTPAQAVQYRTPAGTFGGSSGFLFDPTTSPNVQIVQQNAADVAVRLIAAIGVSGDLLQLREPTNAVSMFVLDANGIPSTPFYSNGTARGATFGAGAGTNATSCAFGDQANGFGGQNISIGFQATCEGGTSRIAIGYQSDNDTNNSAVIGSRNAQCNLVRFGGGGEEILGDCQSVTLRGSQSNTADKAAADLILSTGAARGTGAVSAGAHSAVILKASSEVGTSGTGQGTANSRFVCQGHRVPLTNATNVDLFDIALPTLRGAGGKVTVTLNATDGADVQTTTYVLTFAAVNKGGAYTTDIDTVATSTAPSTGTLSATFNFSTGADLVTFRVNATSSLTPTAFFALLILENDSEQEITLKG